MHSASSSPCLCSPPPSPVSPFSFSLGPSRNTESSRRHGRMAAADVKLARCSLPSPSNRAACCLADAMDGPCRTSPPGSVPSQPPPLEQPCIPDLDTELSLFRFQLASSR
ncbi:uncharacterized protein LOC123430043 [Hordeum vulgare subsp. vulgare]|uniref:uncharacterized protein LOC123430043 n=1 Tax=Hordeum vulgare subsp. vulgare TaxID=112509 RepID=UPI001D1A4189|nr:uncharacterized protein LOC123430043 [Hordeum vulgare subsp. vulgare]